MNSDPELIFRHRDQPNRVTNGAPSRLSKRGAPK
jgi:hypothetical protein